MEKLPVDNRPWGKFIKFCQNESVTVKIIEVQPGHQLSLQRHQKRDEMWIALDPGLVALVGNRILFMKDTEVDLDPIWIPRKELHSVKNANVALVARFLEISYGEYDENDIERVEDNYGRV